MLCGTMEVLTAKQHCDTMQERHEGEQPSNKILFCKEEQQSLSSRNNERSQYSSLNQKTRLEFNSEEASIAYLADILVDIFLSQHIYE